MEECEIIKDLYRQYWRYMIEKDTAGLRGIFSDDYQLIHMTGVRQNAESFLEGLKNGVFNYYSADHDEITVEINEDTAKMTGKSRVEAAVYGGGRNNWHLRGDFTLKKENGKWLFTSSKASVYGG